MAAGNRATDKAQVFTMSFPLKDRFSEIELTLDDDVWCDWAMQNGINPHIIAFIKWKPSALYSPPQNTEDKGSTPRGVVRASNMLKNCDDLSSAFAHTLVCAAVGEAFGTEFSSYVTISSKIDFNMLLKNPKKVKELKSNDQLYAICGLLGEHIAKVNITERDKISAMFEISHNLPNEFSLVALNMIKNSCQGGIATFKRIITFYPDHRTLIGASAKFVM
jgi:hypothetical protein